MFTNDNRICTNRGRLLELNILDANSCQASFSTPAIDCHDIDGAVALVCVEYDKSATKFYHTVDLFDGEGDFIEHYHEDFYLYLAGDETEVIHKDLFRAINYRWMALKMRLIKGYVDTFDRIDIEEGCVKFYDENTEKKKGECRCVIALSHNEEDSRNIVVEMEGKRMRLVDLSPFEVELVLNYLRERFPV